MFIGIRTKISFNKNDISDENMKPVSLVRPGVPIPKNVWCAEKSGTLWTESCFQEGVRSLALNGKRKWSDSKLTIFGIMFIFCV